MRHAKTLRFDRASLPVLVRIAGFVAITLAPLAVWLVLGTVEPYGRPHTTFPRIGALLEGRGYDKFGNAVLDRSAATRSAVRLKYNFDYDVLHTVDAADIVSGKDGWLFYKPEFWDGKCLDPDRVRRALAQLEVMTEMAGAGGLDMVVAVAPDKSTVYPEMLAPAYRRYWNCKQESAALWRKIAHEETPGIVDHLVPLLAEKGTASVPVYFPRDTHWTPYAAALALRQLIGTIIPTAPVDQAELAVSQIATRYSDLAKMLLIGKAEPYEVARDGIADVARDERRTVVLHDSFYMDLLPRLQRIFPNSVAALLDDWGNAGQVAGAERLIVSSVERSLLRRLERGSLKPTSTLAKVILARNAEAAKGCTFHILDGQFPSTEVSSSGEPGERAMTVDVPELGKGLAACLKLRLEDWRKGPVEIFLPQEGARESAFAPGRSVIYEPDAGSTVALVLPDHVQGRAVKIAVPQGARLAEIALGERPSLAPAP